MDIRSAVPSQLIAESGSDLVVINLGSANLRVGLATQQYPLVIPHCIAHHTPVPAEFIGDRQRKKGSVAEQGVPAKSASALKNAERDGICQMIESQLKMKPFFPDQEGSPYVHREDWTIIQLNDDESFPWTEVVIEGPVSEIDALDAKPSIISSSLVDDDHHPTYTISSDMGSEAAMGPNHEHEIRDEAKLEIPNDGEQGIVSDMIEETPRDAQVVVEDADEETRKDEEIVDSGVEGGRRKESDEENVEKFEEETSKESGPVILEASEEQTRVGNEQDGPTEPKHEVHDGPDLEIHVEVRLEPEDSLKLKSQSILPNSLSNTKYRKYICGEGALNIAASEPYVLRRPLCRGHLNVTPQYSLQQVCDDLYSIWDWVLTEKVSLESKTRELLSAVLVVPDTMDNREIKEVLSVILRDLKFRSAVVHQESVAATFGNGISTACVVNMGAQVTSIVCVEDGVAITPTRIVLPFGGEDISRCLLWVQQRWQTWPPVDTNPLDDPLDLRILERIKEAYCLIFEGDQSALIEIPYHEAGKPSLIYKGLLTALNVPMMGLFYPLLLETEEFPAPLRPGFHIDHEDVLDDSFLVETTRKSDIPSAGLPLVSNGGAQAVLGTSEGATDLDTKSQEFSPEESSMGLSRAIVNSILTNAGRPDLQKKLFASIQLVGGTANTKGLVDAVEERVLHDIPAHEAVDTVAVLQNRTDGPIACWKGGAVLGILDFSRDAWVHHDDWVTGGVRLGCSRKYKDSFTLHSQAFYYSATVE